jgi:hypothetical protein
MARTRRTQASECVWSAKLGSHPKKSNDLQEPAGRAPRCRDRCFRRRNLAARSSAWASTGRASRRCAAEGGAELGQRLRVFEPRRAGREVLVACVSSESCSSPLLSRPQARRATPIARRAFREVSLPRIRALDRLRAPTLDSPSQTLLVTLRSGGEVRVRLAHLSGRAG